MISQITLPNVICAALKEGLSYYLPNSVYFEDGTRVSRERQNVRYIATRAAVQHVQDNPPIPEVQQMLAILNDLPPHRFTRMVNAHMIEAVDAARAIPNDAVRIQQQRILRAIQGQPQPLYRPSNNTVRVFELHQGLQNLRSDLRAILTQDWIEFDLVSSQFAICAAIWPIPEVQFFLQQGQNIWLDLQAYFELDATTFTAIKPALKDALYKALFGAIRRTITQGTPREPGLTQQLQRYGIVDGGARFLAHPLLNAVLQARTRKMQAVQADQGLRTVFGTFIFARKNIEIRSALAQEAQAVELQLLLPVLDLCRQTRQFAITLWQHDGFSIAVRDSQRKEQVVRDIKQCVQSVADACGVITCLRCIGEG